jgi:hypothetical protein
MAILAALRDCFRTRAALQMEMLALRHQLNVLRRSVKRAKLTAADRLLCPAVAVLDRLAVCPGDRETGDGDRLAL